MTFIEPEENGLLTAIKMQVEDQTGLTQEEMLRIIQSEINKNVPSIIPLPQPQLKRIDLSKPSEINPDAMTYEELLELEEKMGKVSKGLTKEQIKVSMNMFHLKFLLVSLYNKIQCKNRRRSANVKNIYIFYN